MGAKYHVYSVTEEKPVEELQKQIGCMNGLLQLFDRHHFLSGRRLIAQSHKPRQGHHLLPPLGQKSNHEMQAKNASQRTPEKNLKNIRDKHRNSTESARTSFSSSPRSSSFSSADTNQTSNPERLSSSQTNFHETQSQDIPGHATPNVPSASPPSQNSFDLHDVVKHSIQREARGLAIKTATKKEVGRQTLKYIDSPRPLQSPKSAKARVSGQNWNESFRVLRNLQEPSRILNEREDGSLTHRPADAARYSYDGRLSHDSPKLKIKDQPRLSLGSRESSLNGSIKGYKNNMLGDLQIRKLRSMDTADQQQEPESYRGPSTVIAKLMGLEAYPDPAVANPTTWPEVKFEPYSQSLSTDDNKQNSLSGSPRNSIKELKPCSMRNTDSVRKPITSKCQNEPAPWKQQDVSRSQAPASKYRETLTKVPSSTITVYGEIEKRLAQLEFRKSGKDLRALKQILEAMQKTKKILESRKEDEVAHIASPMGRGSSLDQSSKSACSGNLETNAASSGKVMLNNSKSAIAVMKPTKLHEKATNSRPLTIATKNFSRLQQGESAVATNEKVEKQSAIELTPRLNHLRVRPRQPYPMDKSIDRTPRASQTSEGPTIPAREKKGPNKTSEARTSRLQDKKLGLEKQTNCKITRSDPGRQSGQPSRQQTDSTFPCKKSKHRSPRSHQNENQPSDLRSHVRDLSHQGDATSMQSDSNISSASLVEDEVTSTGRSGKTARLIFQQNVTEQNEARFIEDNLKPGHIKITPEQPSPISVLDATFYGDESPSPVKKISHDFKDDMLNPYEAEWSSASLAGLPSCNLRSQQDLIVKNAGHLVQKHIEIDFPDQESMINEATSMSNRQNADHEYIKEILSASSILHDLESAYLTLQLRPSAQLINPELFLTLEKMKASDDKNSGRKINQFDPVDKVRRKLVFDAVNEIIPCKLRMKSYGKQWLPLNRKLDKQQRGQQLIRELCSEMEHLRATNSNLEEDDDVLRSMLWQDLTLGSLEWTDSVSEIPWLVLDVERLIFKDLINEVITDEAINHPRQLGGHCREFFSTRI